MRSRIAIDLTRERWICHRHIRRRYDCYKNILRCFGRISERMRIRECESGDQLHRLREIPKGFLGLAILK